MATPEGSRVSTVKHQAGHGFNRGQPVVFRVDRYVLASLSTGFDGVVGTVSDINRFELVTGGELDGLAGLSSGAVYYLSTTPGRLSLSGSRPVLRASDSTHAWIANGQTAVSQSASTIEAALQAHVNASDPHPGYATESDLERYIPVTSAGANGIALLATVTPRDARVVLQQEPSNKTLTYSGDLLMTMTDAYGSKTFAYDVNDRLTGWVGTGAYRSATLTYSGDQLTGVVYSG